MVRSRDDVLEMALLLSEADRLEIATRLLDTVGDDLPGLAMDDPDLIAELDRRRLEETESIPASEIWKRD